MAQRYIRYYYTGISSALVFTLIQEIGTDANNMKVFSCKFQRLLLYGSK